MSNEMGEWGHVSETISYWVQGLDPRPYEPKLLKEILKSSYKSGQPVLLVLIDCVPCDFCLLPNGDVGKKVRGVGEGGYGSP